MDFIDGRIDGIWSIVGDGVLFPASEVGINLGEVDNHPTHAVETGGFRVRVDCFVGSCRIRNRICVILIRKVLTNGIRPNPLFPKGHLVSACRVGLCAIVARVVNV